MNEYLLFFSLFVPRISLFFAFVSNAIPVNFVPFWADVVLAIFIPRLLILLYIYGTLGADSGWFIAHVIFFILSLGSSSAGASSCVNRS